MGLVNTIALDIEFLRDTDDGRLFLRCACGEWWDITRDLGKVYVADTVFAALQHYAAHDSEHAALDGGPPVADAYTEADVQLSAAAIIDDDLHEGGTAERTARAVLDALAAADRLCDPS